MDSLTGAALTRFLVNTPAAVQGTADLIIARSGSPDCLIPAAMPENVKPGTLIFRDFFIREKERG
jgi:hypothetical protein